MRTLLFCVLTVTIFPLLSQTNNFAPVGATWYYTDIYGIDYDDTIYIAGYNKVESIGDAVIDGIQCRELKFTFIDPSGATVDDLTRYVYEDNEKVYFYTDDKFELVYDFTGEDWYAHDIYYESGDSALIIVDSVVFEMYDGSLLKTLYIQYDFTSNLLYPSKKIVEKIGPLCYLFLYNGGDDSFPPSGLRCYEDSEVNYQVYNDYSCDTLTPEITNIDISQVSPFEIFYANDAVQISGISETTEILFINSLGQIVSRQTLISNSNLSVKQLQKGNYILFLKTETNIFSHKIFIL